MIEGILQRFVSGLLGRVVIGGFTVLASLRYGTGLYFWRVTEKLERPSYEVIKKLPGKVEIRRYESYLIAETTIPKIGFRESTGEGFKACAGYIFGKNKPRSSWGIGGGDRQSGEKMAMTAPVRSSISGEKMAMTAPVRVDGSARDTKVSFVIGSKYSMKTVPKPIDNKVKLRRIPPHTLAVKTFAGPPPKDDRVINERKKLETQLAKENIEPKTKDTLVYGYHDPFLTPNFLRRNEVAVVIDGSI